MLKMIVAYRLLCWQEEKLLSSTATDLTLMWVKFCAEKSRVVKESYLNPHDEKWRLYSVLLLAETKLQPLGSSIQVENKKFNGCSCLSIRCLLWRTTDDQDMSYADQCIQEIHQMSSTCVSFTRSNLTEFLSMTKLTHSLFSAPWHKDPKDKVWH